MGQPTNFSDAVSPLTVHDKLARRISLKQKRELPLEAGINHKLWSTEKENHRFIHKRSSSESFESESQVVLDVKVIAPSS